MRDFSEKPPYNDTIQDQSEDCFLLLERAELERELETLFAAIQVHADSDILERPDARAWMREIEESSIESTTSLVQEI